MYQAPPTYHKNRPLIKHLWLKIILVALINGLIANIALWVKHHEGIFWSFDYQKFNIINALMLLIGNSFFIGNLIAVIKYQRMRRYLIIWIGIALMLNDWLFRAFMGADFAQWYLSRLPVGMLIGLWLADWLNGSTPSA